MNKRTSWTLAYRNEFIQWHESVIAQYPEDVQIELRRARIKFLAGVRLSDSANEGQ
jgi:hypothetical protein